jgi:hypothetical protein
VAAAHRAAAHAAGGLLLGVSAQASRQRIIAAHKRLIAQVHPDRRGGDARLVHEANDARDTLLAALGDGSPPDLRGPAGRPDDAASVAPASRFR